MQQPKLIFIGGKGGVGKTTIAAALALLLAKDKRVLVVSTDPAHSLADAFDVAVGASPKAITSNLDALEIDPDQQVKAHLRQVTASMKQFARPQLHAQLERQMAQTQESPGAQEAALLEKIATIIDEGAINYDHVIFDTAPTGHTLRLFSLPQAIATWSQGLLKNTQTSVQLGEVLEHLGHRPEQHSQNTSQKTSDSRFAVLTKGLQARQQRFHRVKERLYDRNQAAIYLVMTAEKLPLLETQRTVNYLQQQRLPLAGLFVNKLLEQQHVVGDFMQQRYQQQQWYIEQIEKTLQGVSRHDIPLFSQDLDGQMGLQALARHLQQFI